MEDKVLGYLAKNAVQIGECMCGVECALRVLIKQGKINKRQRAANVLFAVVLVCCIGKIGELEKRLDNIQRKEIDGNSEEPKN